MPSNSSGGIQSTGTILLFSAQGLSTNSGKLTDNGIGYYVTPNLDTRLCNGLQFYMYPTSLTGGSSNTFYTTQSSFDGKRWYEIYEQDGLGFYPTDKVSIVTIGSGATPPEIEATAAGNMANHDGDVLTNIVDESFNVTSTAHVLPWTRFVFKTNLATRFMTFDLDVVGFLGGDF